MIRNQNLQDASGFSYMCFEWGVCYHKPHAIRFANHTDLLILVNFREKNISTCCMWKNLVCIECEFPSEDFSRD